MSKTTIAIIIYITVLILGAFFMGLWDAKTSIIKSGFVLGWTIILLICLYKIDKNEKK